MAVRRACGYRKPGKTYVTFKQGRIPKNMTWINFVVDPVMPFEKELLSAQGVNVLPRIVGYDLSGNLVQAVGKDGEPIFDFYDWVSSGDYPDVAAFIEEVFRYGVSRLNPRTTQFEKMGKYSQYCLVHPNAFIDEPQAHWRQRAGIIAKRLKDGKKFCIKSLPEHDDPNVDRMEYDPIMCASLWWEDITVPTESVASSRECKVQLAAGDWFTAYTPPAGSNKLVRKPAVFMHFPIAAMADFEVVIDAEENSHMDSLAALKNLKDSLRNRVRVTND